ncbi:hypothetical protein ACFQJC_16600 [Haloferax namakaokahaiae]|uniref:Uncharacterized protein n=1 Tax=Haloferax namakaokahaiae TaxID=1748331 RepID=A0ABD5ZIL2_9EURY
MCRETKREPAWVSVIRLAFLRGTITVEAVMEEANLQPGHERTVQDVLSTMADRNLIRPVESKEGTYVPGPVLIESDRYNLDFSKASDGGAHRWQSAN